VSPEALLHVKDLRGGYGRVEILRGVSLQVHAGEIVALLGSNGAGKSTLNNILSGIVPTWSGHVHFDGRDITGASARSVVQAGLIQVPEGRRVFPNLSVHENLELGSYARGRERRASNLDKVFSTFPRLAERTTQLAGTLSGGEQQMLAIGRALMGNPKFLMLDEPSLGIAPRLISTIFEKIVEINKSHGITILLVEQNANLALEVSSYAYCLETGRIAMEGESKKLRADPQLKATYLGG
jgi:branched-chain amino acid transport system ATP-binding protein